MSTVISMSPDEAALRRDLQGPRLRAGFLVGKWRLHSVDFPNLIIEVGTLAVTYVALRFNVSGYPHRPPTAQAWDVNINAPLAPALFPKGPKRIEAVFRTDWKAGTALYLPCDREAIEGHDVWRQQHPEMIWRPEIGLAHYLSIVSELLHTSDFHDPRNPA